MKSLLFTVLMVFIISGSSQGQGAFLDFGKSGVGFGLGFASNDKANTLSGEIGYSIKGIFDIGISGGYSPVKHRDMYSLYYAPNVTLYALKQNENTPLSIAVGASYIKQEIYYTANSDYFYNSGNSDSYNNSFYIIDVSFFKYFSPSPGFKIQPLLGLSYTSSPNDYEDGMFSYGVSASFIFDASSTNIFAINPMLVFNENSTTIGISLILIAKI